MPKCYLKKKKIATKPSSAAKVLLYSNEAHFPNINNTQQFLYPSLVSRSIYLTHKYIHIYYTHKYIYVIHLRETIIKCIVTGKSICQKLITTKRMQYTNMQAILNLCPLVQWLKLQPLQHVHSHVNTIQVIYKHKNASTRPYLSISPPPPIYALLAFLHSSTGAGAEGVSASYYHPRSQLQTQCYRCHHWKMLHQALYCNQLPQHHCRKPQLPPMSALHRLCHPWLTFSIFLLLLPKYIQSDPPLVQAGFQMDPIYRRWYTHLEWTQSNKVVLMTSTEPKISIAN